MKIKDIMTASPTYLMKDATIQEAAQKMQELDCGFIPVGGSDQKLCGIVTDRDIVTRAVSQNLSASTKLSEVMSDKVLYCYETDTTEQVARNMADNQIRRLVVLDNPTSKKLCGVVAVSDIVTANKTSSETSSQLIKSVSTTSSNANSKTGSSKTKAA